MIFPFGEERLLGITKLMEMKTKKKGRRLELNKDINNHKTTIPSESAPLNQDNFLLAELSENAVLSWVFMS